MEVVEQADPKAGAQMDVGRDLLGGPASLLRGLAVAVWVVASACANASAQESKPLRGVALVLGQSNYEHLSNLANPKNDARAVEELLNGLGFETDIATDRSARRLKRDIETFAEDAEGADVALVYYSGHGIEAGGENYLVPVDASLDSLDDAEEKFASLSELLEDLRSKVKITVVLLDACRTSPFPPGAILKLNPGDQATPIGSAGLAATKGAESAFLPLDPTGVAEGSLGEVIGFAAAPGYAALDGAAGGNSPYAAALLKHLAAGGLEFGQVMTLVAEEVYLSTRGQQQPWTNASLRRLLFFGQNPEEETGDEALIRGERRSLLLTIAASADDLRRTVETIAQADEVPLDGLYAMLNALGVDASVDPANLDKQLRAGSEKLKGFLNERTALTSADAEIVRLSGLADRAVQEGALQAAVTFHERAKARVASLEASVGAGEADLRARRLEFGEVFARSAETQELAFDYLKAANDWARAFEQVERWDDDLAFTYRLAHADALSRHGDYKGDNNALNKAVALYRDAQRLAPREAHADGWATAQTNLGTALAILGDREVDTKRLEEAVFVQRGAVEARAAVRDPLLWAEAQNNLGNALAALGERQYGTERLEEAVAAYHAVLEQWTREQKPLNWAAAQVNLGLALWRLGQREFGTEHLEQAVAAYRAALEEYTRERAPLGWATTQDNLGNALVTLGERESGSARLEEAVVAFRLALEVRTQERLPLAWADTQNNLGIALWRLGERESGTERLEEAVAVFHAALEERAHERTPLHWSHTQNNLGNVFVALGEREAGTKSLEQALVAYRAVLEEWTRERAPLDWALTQKNLGLTLFMLGAREGGTERLEEAVTAYRAALEERTPERVPVHWALTQHGLAIALALLGERAGDAERLEEAVGAYRAALEVYTRDRAPIDWAMIQDNLGWTLKVLGERKRDGSLVQSGRESVAAAWDISKAAGHDADEYFSKRLAEFDKSLAELTLRP
jgi:uncharacterized caspase-like protein